MNIFTLKFFSFKRLASIFTGLLFVVSGSLYFFGVSAQTENKENTAEQNLILGKLAVVQWRVGFGDNQRTIILSNSEGSERTYLPTLGQYPDMPSWSPDGTKIAFAAREPSTPGQQDIYSMPTDGSSQFTNLTNTSAAFEQNPSWSVTGKIAYERDSQIWTMNANGSGQAQFTAITQPTPTSPSWSPNATRLAFSSGDHIWLINADGTNQVRLTPQTGGVQPAWSPDGMKIAYRKGSGGIAVINIDGSNETSLTNASDSRPAWSPDGTRIAFRREGSEAGIYVMDAVGGNQIRLFADQILFPMNCCDTHYYNPVWQPVDQTPNTYTISGRVSYSNSPVSGATVNLSGTIQASTITDSTGNYQFSNLPSGGRYVVSPSFPKHYFTPPNRTFIDLNSTQIANFEVRSVCQNGRCGKNGRIAYTINADIYTINADGTNAVNITNSSTADTAPDYSPDGSKIAFSTNRDGNYEIYRMDTNGGDQVRLTNNEASDIFPSYSPDGASIVFGSNRDGNYEIYKMNADGSNQVRLTNTTTNEYYPEFSPDSKKIVYYDLSLSKLMVMNADGSNPQPIPDSPSPGQRYELPSFSKDGSKILFGYNPGGTNLTSTWTMNTDGTNRIQISESRAATYSPDGMQIASVCCEFGVNNPGLLQTTNATGGERKIITTASAGSADNPDWQPLSAPRPTAFDFDGDSRADISVFRPSNSAWYLLRSTAGLWVPVWGASTDVLTPADYDGDLKTDVAVWRPFEGKYYILNSFDGTVRIEGFGLAGDIPTGGDFDGDGKADPAVFRTGAQGIFYYRGSMGNPNGNITSIPWGTTGDKPVASDYDGDGRTDAAVYRNGEWYVRQSSTGQLFGVAFGLGSDKAVPADYDGDGKTDIAVFRDGIWYLLRSTQGFQAFQFGIANDIPTPADYDGDGKADASVYRNGVWWTLNSQTSTAQAASFGIDTDKPIPAVFVR